MIKCWDLKYFAQIHILNKKCSKNCTLGGIKMRNESASDTN